jgi:uncharacterized protein YxeA
MRYQKYLIIILVICCAVFFFNKITSNKKNPNNFEQKNIVQTKPKVVTTSNTNTIDETQSWNDEPFSVEKVCC